MIRANLGTTYLASILKQFEVNNIQIPHDCTSWDLLGSPLSFVQSNEHTSQYDPTRARNNNQSSFGKSNETAQEFNAAHAAARTPTTNRTKQWGLEAERDKQAMEQGVVWYYDSHLG
jgi:hypothetical protein